MGVDVRVISIGAMSSHPLRGERPGVRSGHSTSTLVWCGKACILVDPGLPGAALVARLEERAGIGAREVTHVFLTSFNPEARRGLLAFEGATWWISEAERETIGRELVGRLREAAEQEDEAVREALELEVAILRRCQPCPDTLASHKGQRVDLFPLPGVTPGLSGLLVPHRDRTTLVCGDAVATQEHLEQGQVVTPAFDVEAARRSFAEAVEIADVLIPGRDNTLLAPGKRLF